MPTSSSFPRCSPASRRSSRSWPTRNARGNMAHERLSSSTRFIASTRRSRMRFCHMSRKGSIRLIGATTENPSFEVISALLSRSRVYVLQSLSEEQIVGLLQRALADEERGLGDLHLTAEESALRKIAAYSSGDARSAYNALEVAATLAQEAQSGVTDAIVTDALQKRVLRYDKGGEEHYNLISALHKSVRNSDPDAALYWLGAHAGSGRRSPVCSATRGAHGRRGHWVGRSQRARYNARGPRRVRFSGYAGRRLWHWRKPSSICAPRRSPTRFTRRTER